MTPELEMTGIVKRFDDLVANNHIDLTIEKGEIRALVGENGAGKTTLMRVLFGLYRADAGTIKIRGEEVQFRNPSDAISHRIGMVHQHFMLFEDLTVTENIVYGMEPRRWGFVDQKAARICNLSDHGQPRSGVPVEGSSERHVYVRTHHRIKDQGQQVPDIRDPARRGLLVPRSGGSCIGFRSGRFDIATDPTGNSRIVVTPDRRNSPGFGRHLHPVAHQSLPEGGSCPAR